VAAAEGIGPDVVYAGFSFGVMAAQQLAQTRPGARGALLMSGCLPVTEFGDAWPDSVPVQVHGKDADLDFAEDLEAARTLVDSTDQAELFLYPGEEHLFTDSSLPGYDAAAAALLTERVLAFLDRVQAGARNRQAFIGRGWAWADSVAPRGACFITLGGLEQTQFAGGEPAERARTVPDPVLVGDERHPLPRGSVLQADRAGGLHVLPERTQVETVEIAGELEVDVDFLAALECRVDRLDDLPVLLACELPGCAEAEGPCRQIRQLLDQRRESSPLLPSVARSRRYCVTPAILHSRKRACRGAGRRLGR
jgi:pimeloyl-ACP methyl ester carboxylesterase